MLTLQDGIDGLYQKAVVEGKSTSTVRLKQLAALCVQELERRGVPGAQSEVKVPGIGRHKNWDVAWSHNSKVRLGISLKSILRNLGGSVPNRADDLMGEMANVQLHSPEIVTGYIMVLNTEDDPEKKWIDTFRSYVGRLSGRQAPAWAAGMVEASAVVEVDFAKGPTLLSPADLNDFFDCLADRLKQRNPGLVE